MMPLFKSMVESIINVGKKVNHSEIIILVNKLFLKSFNIIFKKNIKIIKIINYFIINIFKNNS